MNKKVSTLLTAGLLVGGTLFVPANAKEISGTDFLKAVAQYELSKVDLNLPEGDKVIELTSDVNNTANYPVIIIGEDFEGYTFTSTKGIEFNGQIIVAAENVTIEGINFVKSKINYQETQSSLANSALAVFADKVTVKNNTFSTVAEGGNVNNSMVGVVLFPQNDGKADYSSVLGNTIKGFNHSNGTQTYSSAVVVSENTIDGIARGLNPNTDKSAADLQASLKDLIDNGTKGLSTKGSNGTASASGLMSTVGENKFTGNTVNAITSNNQTVTSVELGNVNTPAAKLALKDIVANSSENLQVIVVEATVEEIQAALEGIETDGKNLVIVSENNQSNVIVGEGRPENDYDNNVTESGVVYLNAVQLNDVNRGSFSLTYQFDKDHKATENPFDKELKAFHLFGDQYHIYLATSWPATAGEVLTREEFNKCEFIVATPSEDVEKYWNIKGHNSFGESSKFTVVKGDRLTYDANWNKEEWKSGKFAIQNAQFVVTDDYVFALPKVYAYEDEKIKVSGDRLTVALISDRLDRIVTTTYNATEEKDKLEVNAIISNTRTVTADKFLSTEKASVFNVKFVSKYNSDATKSEYNKYLSAFAGTTLAHGSDFTNLNAPESQWIITSVSGNEYTFQNREDESVSFTAELLSTDKENVYELRSSSELNSYAYVENGYKKVNANLSMNEMFVELTAVTPDAEAGYATTELDNAGLVRFVFNRIQDDNLEVSDFYVTANEKNVISTDKNEEKAAQFSVVKFDAASTATALSDTIFADNNYAVWNATDKKVEVKKDADLIKVVSYAFKQLRADGENYYLAGDMQTVVKCEEADAPRFVVKLYKNGSYGLVPVYKNAWWRGDYFRNTINEYTNVFTLNTNAEIVQSESVYYAYATKAFDFNILKETPGTSFEHKAQHVTMEAVNGGYVAMDAENKDGIVAPVSTLKAEYTKEDLTFWLDTTDSEAVTPSFMISKAGNYMYNATDSLNNYNDGTASAEQLAEFGVELQGEYYPKAIFQSADLTKVGDVKNYKFQIVQSADNADEYVIKSLNGYKYVAAHNQKLYFTSVAKDALKVVVTPAEAPTSNESVSASEVAVVAQNGSVVVKNAAGKNVVVSTILGQVVANEVLTSDNATINVPAGIVVVAVEGESFKVNVK